MARYSAVVESGATLGSNTAFANVVAAAAVGFRLRRLKLGVRTTTAVVPTSQQVTVGINRATARGTSTGTTTGQKLDPTSAASGITGVDITWSVTPTLTASAMDEISFNTQTGIDLPWEFIEELYCPVGTANGLALVNLGLTLPTNHFITAGITWEE